MKDYILEVCVDSMESAKRAMAGGATRLEVCMNLQAGGTTPSIGLYRELKRQIPLPIHVLIRPRPGDFLYDNDELIIMKEDIKQFVLEGADGIVIGCLDKNGQLDINQMKELMCMCKNSQITLHRAFDMTENLLDTFELAVRLKIDYVLTSGGANTCGEGKDNIRALLNKQRRTRVLIGGGLNADTIQEFLPYGARCFHMSGSEVVNSDMQFRKEGIFMGKESGEEYLKYRTSEVKIKQVHYCLSRENG